MPSLCAATAGRPVGQKIFSKGCPVDSFFNQNQPLNRCGMVAPLLWLVRVPWSRVVGSRPKKWTEIWLALSYPIPPELPVLESAWATILWALSAAINLFVVALLVCCSFLCCWDTIRRWVRECWVRSRRAVQARQLQPQQHSHGPAPRDLTCGSIVVNVREATQRV